MLGVRSNALVITQCLEVLHPMIDLASNEIEALLQPI